MSDEAKDKIEPYYQREAKRFVDMLFDNKMLNPDFSRDNMQTIEDYVAYMFQANANSAAKTAVIIEQINSKKKINV